MTAVRFAGFGKAIGTTPQTNAVVAAELGIPRPTLNYKMAKYDIVPPEESIS